MPDRLANYVPVAERLTAAQGEIIAVEADPPTMLTDSMGYIRIAVYLSDGRKATGTASFRLDLEGRSAQATNPIEDCETSALGRALGMLGYSSNKSIASRDEVREAQRRQGASYNPPAETRTATRPAPAQQPAPATNGNGSSTKRSLTQQELTEALKTLWAEERRLGGETPATEIAVDLDEASREQLIGLGKKARARVLALEQRPHGMPETDLPASLPTTTTA